MTKRVARIARIVFLAAGLVLLTLLVREIGIAAIIANIKEVREGFFLILVISFAWYLLYTSAWQQFLIAMEATASFWSLFRIKMTGEAVNTLTPMNFIGGDPMRIYLLKRSVSLTEGAASVVVDRTLHSIAILLVVLVGMIIAWVNMEVLPGNIKYGVPLVLVVFIFFVSFIFIHQQRGIFGLFLTLCKRFGFKREFSDATVARFEELDSQIIEFYEYHHAAFFTALSLHVLGRILGVFEVYAIGKCVSSDFSLFAALVLCVLAPLINAMFTFIPGAIGIMEGAYSGALFLMGLDPALGITIQITKRLRAAFWITLGLFFLMKLAGKKALTRNVLEGME